jgi:hypothetical protein
VAFDILWVPFDKRFSDLLERLQQQQALFDIELRLESEKALSRFMKTVEKDIYRRETLVTDPLNWELREELAQERAARESK